ncbi:MAG: family 10 glycosylhydrolase, partial [Cyanothece sp. SIO1E1]|nr:family 10 glycosylhydrolase [Cyanothece sp. SIO1E1]
MFSKKYRQRFTASFSAAFLAISGLGVGLLDRPAQAQTNAYCHLSADAVNQKETLRRAAFQGDAQAKKRYQNLVVQHRNQVRQCRDRTWPQQQAIWLRLYPCDSQSGILEAVLDQIVNRGYNQVYVEAFYDGQVLLPAAQNSTAWPSVIRSSRHQNRDLLAEAIAKGRERGLEVYAWMFTLNFGYSYGQRADRQDVLARNGSGQNSLALTASTNLGSSLTGISTDNAAFIDPYHPQARQDYSQLVQAIAQRNPDGILFDYVRYPRGLGAASVASRVQDLWIYGDAAQRALHQRGLNQQGTELIRRFVSRGHVTASDLEAVKQLYPNEAAPRWHGLDASVETRTQAQFALWRLSVAHAVQGVLDFVAAASKTCKPCLPMLAIAL